ncbi:Hypothetical protein PAU_04369 [Photorhabdus asymbiotica]|uniref:Uncharacterized protein n=1 Tax=Photorhabdus asymbiotica subsp. asymbiotica (strain ATCC 43949 / 3105-77) TaxID=553480 RepID=C7BT22_PHOAA|nr:Hypothetical protein PAU_04369 [Photorhabdus asymbiotica]
MKNFKTDTHSFFSEFHIYPVIRRRKMLFRYTNAFR